MYADENATVVETPPVSALLFELNSDAPADVLFGEPAVAGAPATSPRSNPALGAGATATQGDGWNGNTFALNDQSMEIEPSLKLEGSASGNMATSEI